MLSVLSVLLGVAVALVIVRVLMRLLGDEPAIGAEVAGSPRKPTTRGSPGQARSRRMAPPPRKGEHAGASGRASGATVLDEAQFAPF